MLMWTEEMNAYLADRWTNTKDSMSDIADEISRIFHPVSRSSVAGRINRQKLLSGLKRPISLENRPKTQQQQAAAHQTSLRRPAPPASKVKNYRPPEVKVVLKEAPVFLVQQCEPVSLMDLKEWSCRWVVGDDAYCGAQTAPRQSYCPSHARLSLAKSAPRNPFGSKFVFVHRKRTGASFR